MAAKTPTVYNIGPVGNARLILARFTDIDDGDTWASGFSTRILGAQAPCNTTDGVVVSATLSSGTFTFTVAGAGSNKAVDFYVYVRS